MAEFHGLRITHDYTQTNCAAPERVFPLLCPVREADWVPGWQYRMIYSRSGIAEPGCVFITPNEDRSETTWVLTDYDPVAFRIEFVWVSPEWVTAQIKIQLERQAGNQSASHIQYSYTGLSEKGNHEVEHYDEAWFIQKMQTWEAAINHYLRTGKRIEGEAWE